MVVLWAYGTDGTRDVRKVRDKEVLGLSCPKE